MTTGTIAPTTAPNPLAVLWRRHAPLVVIYGLLIVLFLLAAFLSDRFLTARNLSNLLRQAGFLGIVAIGQTVVILSGGIDLSVGSVVKLSVLIAALVVDARPEDEPVSSYEWSTWRMVVQPVPDRRRGPTPRQGRWNLRINEATQPAAQGLLDDLQARYGARLEIVQAVHAGKKGEWLAYLYLRPQPHADD